MESFFHNEAVNKASYRAAVSAEYTQRRHDEIQAQEREVIDRREKVKVLQLRRRREWDAWRADKAAKKRQSEEHERELFLTWQQEWHERIEARVATTKQTMSGLYYVAQTREEKQKLAELKSRQKDRAKVGLRLCL